MDTFIDAGCVVSTPTCGPCLGGYMGLSLIHISEPTRLGMISYAVFCLKKKKKQETRQELV